MGTDWHKMVIHIVLPMLIIIHMKMMFSTKTSYHLFIMRLKRLKTNSEKDVKTASNKVQHVTCEDTISSAIGGGESSSTEAVKESMTPARSPAKDDRQSLKTHTDHMRLGYSSFDTSLPLIYAPVTPEQQLLLACN